MNGQMRDFNEAVMHYLSGQLSEEQQSYFLENLDQAGKVCGELYNCSDVAGKMKLLRALKDIKYVFFQMEKTTTVYG